MMQKLLGERFLVPERSQACPNFPRVAQCAGRDPGLQLFVLAEREPVLSIPLASEKRSGAESQNMMMRFSSGKGNKENWKKA